jgi:hypothetical protein
LHTFLLQVLKNRNCAYSPAIQASPAQSHFL